MVLNKVFLGPKLLDLTKFCLVFSRWWTKSFASHEYRRCLTPSINRPTVILPSVISSSSWWASLWLVSICRVSLYRVSLYRVSWHQQERIEMERSRQKRFQVDQTISTTIKTLTRVLTKIAKIQNKILILIWRQDPML